MDDQHSKKVGRKKIKREAAKGGAVRPKANRHSQAKGAAHPGGAPRKKAALGGGQGTPPRAGKPPIRKEHRQASRPRGSGIPGPRKRYKVKTIWWSGPVATAMAAVLVLLCALLVHEVRGYASFLQKKHVVNNRSFYPGVSMDGVDLSGMTFDQAVAEWSARDQEERERYKMVLTMGGESWPITAESLGFESDYMQQLLSAWSTGRYGTLEERYAVVSTLRADGWQRDFVTTKGLNQEVAMQKLQPFASSLSVEPVGAKVVSFNETEKTFEFTDCKVGYLVEAAELYQDILRAAEAGAKEVAINRHKLVPEDTAATLAESYGMVAGASTDGSFSNSNRLTNLKVACRALNGMRIEPGETFSFNKALGKRTADAGYKPAAAYENGVATNQYGGGICQVSTTLFNAVAKADLKITERGPHSRPSSYIGIGKDAVVNWPNQDFKFTNNTSYPIYIVAGVNNKKRVQVGIYGKKLPNGMTIEISSETTKTYPTLQDKVTTDSSLLPGEKVVVEAARKGYSATTYKHYLDANGKELRKVVLCKSYYAPSGAIVRIGEQ